MAGGNPSIPHITVVTDFVSTQSLSTRPSRLSLDVPPRPSPSYAPSIDEGSIGVPPSPSLSAESLVHFVTSVVLRENKPRDETSSLGLLNDKLVAKHGRRPSWASSSEGHSSLDGTVPNYGAVSLSPLRRVTSAAAGTTAESLTHMYLDNLSEWSCPRSRRMQKDNADSDGVTAIFEHSPERAKLGGGREAAEELDNTRIDFGQGSDGVNPIPFAFKPFMLADMLDPKNLDILEGLGGTQGLLKGLGTNLMRGLGGNTLTKMVSSVDSRRGQYVKEPPLKKSQVDARGSTFNNVGGDQHNIQIVINNSSSPYVEEVDETINTLVRTSILLSYSPNPHAQMS
jgi:hypothetical protein